MQGINPVSTHLLFGGSFWRACSAGTRPFPCLLLFPCDKELGDSSGKEQQGPQELWEGRAQPRGQFALSPVQAIADTSYLSLSNSTSSTRKSRVSTSLWICCTSSSSLCFSSLDFWFSASQGAQLTPTGAIPPSQGQACSLLLNSELGGKANPKETAGSSEEESPTPQISAETPGQCLSSPCLPAGTGPLPGASFG